MLAANLGGTAGFRPSQSWGGLFLFITPEGIADALIVEVHIC
jgi:hypothetical protein